VLTLGIVLPSARYGIRGDGLTSCCLGGKSTFIPSFEGRVAFRTLRHSWGWADVMLPWWKVVLQIYKNIMRSYVENDLVGESEDV
jgi:hypothetical protein